MQVATCITRKGHSSCATISEEGRQQIYTDFHSLKTLKDQREFFIFHIQVNDPKTKVVTGDSRKSKTKSYSLTYNNEKHVVCRDFFFAL